MGEKSPHTTSEYRVTWMCTYLYKVLYGSDFVGILWRIGCMWSQLRRLCRDIVLSPGCTSFRKLRSDGSRRLEETGHKSDIRANGMVIELCIRGISASEPWTESENHECMRNSFGVEQSNRIIKPASIVPDAMLAISLLIH